MLFVRWLIVAVVVVCLQELLQVKGKDALSPTVPFNEKFTLQTNSNYLVRSLEVGTSSAFYTS